MQILIVDDHMDTRVLCTGIVRAVGHNVVAVPTIKAAHEATNTSSFDLVISDIMLSDGTGYELMRDLSDAYGLQGIALTGCTSQLDVARCRAAGFSHHLAKPFDPRTLVQLINRISSEQQRSQRVLTPSA